MKNETAAIHLPTHFRTTKKPPSGRWGQSPTRAWAQLFHPIPETNRNKSQFYPSPQDRNNPKQFSHTIHWLSITTTFCFTQKLSKTINTYTHPLYVPPHHPQKTRNNRKQNGRAIAAQPFGQSIKGVRQPYAPPTKHYVANACLPYQRKKDENTYGSIPAATAP